MVVTKSEEIANQLTGLTTLVETMNTNLTGKIDTLTDTASALNERIDKVNIDLTNEFKQYRTFIENEIQLLKDSDQVVLDQFAAFERDSNVKVANVNDDLQRTKQLLQKKTVSLEVASAQLKVQSKKIVSLEKACHRGLQHGRSFNVEIDGIPVNVGDEDDQLEDAALKIFHAINADISNFDIDTIHRLPSKRSPKPTIVRFVSRKSVRELHKNKHKLRNLNDLDIDVPGINDDSRIFIRSSQCGYYKNLAYNCRKLKRNGDVEKIFTSSDGRITIQLPDRTYLKVTHSSVLSAKFPDFEDFV